MIASFNLTEPEQHNDLANPYSFTGRQFDDETGLYYYRNRFYGWHLGRFVSRDPIGYADGGNLYGAYFVPNSTDPFGLIDWSQWPNWLDRNISIKQLEEKISRETDPQKRRELQRAKKILQESKRLAQIKGKGRRRPPGGRGSRLGSAKGGLLTKLCLAEYEIACREWLDKCVVRADKSYDMCLETANTQEDIDLCKRINLLDLAECSIKYTACGLGCLLPFGDYQPKPF